jgi:hypothetical protein
MMMTMMMIVDEIRVTPHDVVGLFGSRRRRRSTHDERRAAGSGMAVNIHRSVSCLFLLFNICSS